ncbi:uncharacterized protein EV420DRAFT_1633784 [Desarmillaria tabescens]|uniref:Transmembrane protein n=1 Tax=Armillaria tabescens TaxID=1929756 RepID=A0AA39NPC8_ARMTA|nr:uncharacterized protein EV420DRAFT_1633784 [Desarmillaria tabescens]KAK0469372.1 hypothetical protein EV420DRAFT_1633784 [Desarmillaria tabescens]
MPSMVFPASETPSYVEGPLGLYDSSRLHSRDLPKSQKPPVVASERTQPSVHLKCRGFCEGITSVVDDSSQVHTEHSINTHLLASEGNEDTPQPPRLSTLSILPRTVILNSSYDVTMAVSPARQVPMFASFAPLLSYSTVVLFIAFVASRLQRWFSRRRRRQGSLGLDGVELLPTTTASVLPEFRDYVVQPPNVPPIVLPPTRLGRRIEAHKSIDTFGAVGTRLKKSGRSQSLSLPKAGSIGLHAPIQLRPFASEPRSKSTPNTPNELLVDLSPIQDWSTRDGIHTRKPFVNDALHGSTSLWTADVNVSSDTLFGLRQTLSNRSVDIADAPLKPMVMEPQVLAAPVQLISVAVPEPAVGTKATSLSLSDSYSFEQDITLVHSDSDHPLIDFSPKGGSALDLTVATEAVDDAHEIEKTRDEGTFLPHSSHEEKPLMEFSQWDEEGWGFEVVSLPSVDDEFMGITRTSAVTQETAYEVAEQKLLLPSPAQNSTNVHDEYSVQDITVISSPLHADEKVISADEDAKPDGGAAETATTLLRESVEDALISSAAENLWAAAVLDEGALVVHSSLDAESSEASETVELQDISDNSDPFSDLDDALNSNQTTPPVLVGPPATIDINEQEHDNYDIYDNSDDNKDSFRHPFEVLAEPQRSESLATDTIILSLPHEAECPSPETQLMLDIPPSESSEGDPSIVAELSSQPAMDAPALSPVAVLDSSSASPVDSVGVAQRSPELLNLEDITADVSIPELTPLQLVLDQHAPPTEEFPDPELIPLPISPTERDSSLLVHQTPTPPSLPMSPVRKVPARPAWSLRASDAPPLGLSASTSADGLPSYTEKLGAMQEKVKSEVEKTNDSSLVPPSSSASSMTLSSGLPGAFPEPESKETAIAVSAPKEVEIRPTPSRPRVTRSPIDIALAMQLRPGLGVGADPAWMVRFLMSMFGWFVVMLSGSGGSDGYHYPIRR